MGAYIIAEAGVNHNGRLDLAKELCLAAKNAGADCVKFQTWQTEKGTMSWVGPVLSQRGGAGMVRGWTRPSRSEIWTDNR